MASGHVNRANRPNTWLLRPSAADVKKPLANPEPSTHSPSRRSRHPGNFSSRPVRTCPGADQRSPGRVAQQRGLPDPTPDAGRCAWAPSQIAKSLDIGRTRLTGHCEPAALLRRPQHTETGPIAQDGLGPSEPFQAKDREVIVMSWARCAELRIGGRPQ